MARHRWTLALILICLPILATVITAFRVRDLPKSFQDSLKTELKRHKCDDCDANEVKGGHSDKIESAKHPYDNLKKAVREKQLEIKQKAAGSKINYKFVDDSADDDDDDDLPLLKSDTGYKNEDSKTGKELRSGSILKSEASIKKPTIVFRVDDDDDDDDDDDTDVFLPDKKLQNVESKKKTEPGIKLNVKDIKSKKQILLRSDREEKYADDLVKIHNKVNLNKEIEPGTKNLKVKVSLLKSKLDNDDDDDDDDDDNDDKGNIIMNSANKGDSNNIIDAGSKQKSKLAKEEVLGKKSKSDENDDDDEDDDNDDDDDKDKKLKLIKPIKKADTGSTQNLKRKDTISPKKTKSDDDDNKDNDDDDNDKNGTDNKLLKAKPKPETQHKNDTTKNYSKSSDDTKKQNDQPKIKPTTAKKDDTPQKDPAKKHKEPEKEPSKPKPSQEIKNKPHEQPKNIEKKSTDTKDFKKDTKLIKIDHGKREKSVEMLIESKEVYSRSDNHLKDINEALQRRNLLHSEFEDYYAFFPTFAPNFSRIHNPECRRHGQILLRQLRGSKLWALNMLDATAKIPSGILQGNGIQLGDFDQCLGSRARVQLDTGSVVKLQGKYCLARLDLKAEDPELEVPVHLAQAKNLIKSRIDDPGHFVPRFSTLSWGVCVPDACSPEDVEVVIKDAVKHYQHRSGVLVRVKVDEQDCHTNEGDWWDDWLELPTVLTLSFYAVTILLVLVSTLLDFIARRKSDGGQNEESDEKAECDQKELTGEEEEAVEETNKPASDGFLSAFSLYHTFKKLTAPGTDDEIACIHGVRGIATLALIVGHKFLPVAAMPYTNRVKITEVVSSPLWSWCRAGWVYTDCFLLLSGTLTSHRISSDIDTGAPKRLFSRYLRLTPALLAVVLFYAYVWDNISSGPMWGTLVSKNAEVCQEGWWWNLLYVQNHFGFEDMCAPQTHQLALDFQLTILGGIIVWAIQAKEGVSRVLLPSLHALAAYLRYSTVRDHRLTMVAYHGVTVSQLYRTARLSYTSTLHRSTPYLVGISLGLALHKPSEHGKILCSLGWIISATLWSLVWWAGYDSGYTTYRYTSDFAAQYAAFAPLASALAIAWLIYAAHNSSSDGILLRLLCCRPLVLISRLSYALYLCQFIIFLTNAATVKTSTEFTLTSLIDVQEISWILLSSTVLTLTFVIPMQSLHKVFTFSFKMEDASEAQDEQKETDSSAQEKNENLPKIEEVDGEDIDVPQIKTRLINFMAHREVLEEIPEVEVEFEIQREKMEGLEEILEEEEEDEVNDEEELQNHLDEEDLEIIEEEQGGEDDFWADREEYTPRRSFSRNDDRDLDEWEWTTNGSGRTGAQHFRNTR